MIADRFWLKIIRLNRINGIDRILKSFWIWKFYIQFEFRSAKNLWGRFGGGWNWKLGLQAGGKTIIFNILICSISISFDNERNR